MQSCARSVDRGARPPQSSVVLLERPSPPVRPKLSASVWADGVNHRPSFLSVDKHAVTRLVPERFPIRRRGPAPLTRSVHPQPSGSRVNVKWSSNTGGRGFRYWVFRAELAADLFGNSWEVAAKINLQNCECSLSQLLSGASRRNFIRCFRANSRRRRDDNVHVEQKCCRRDRRTA